jgi:hypothetical protein
MIVERWTRPHWKHDFHQGPGAIGFVARAQEFYLRAKDAQGFTFALLHHNDLLAHVASWGNYWCTGRLL